MQTPIKSVLRSERKFFAGHTPNGGGSGVTGPKGVKIVEKSIIITIIMVAMVYAIASDGEAARKF